MPLASPNLLEEFKTFTAEPYIPEGEIAKQVAETTVIPIVGPQGIGKTSTIGRLVELDPAFSLAISTTSRDSRGPGDIYHFVDHSEVAIAALLRRARTSGVVQGTVHPANGRVYVSFPQDYHPPYALVAPVPSEIPKLERVGFKGVLTLCLASPWDDYRPRLEERRRDLSQAGFCRGLAEGIDNITWSLERGDQTIWVENATGRITDTAQHIRQLVSGDRPTNRMQQNDLRIMARGMRRGMEALLERYS